MSNSSASIREPLLKQSHIIFLLVSLILAVVFVLIALFATSMDDLLKTVLYSSAASLLIAAAINAAINHISIKHQTDYTYKLIKTLKYQERMGLSYIDVQTLKEENISRFFKVSNGVITVLLMTGNSWVVACRGILSDNDTISLNTTTIRFIFPNFLNNKLIDALCYKYDGKSEKERYITKTKDSIRNIRDQLASHFESVEYYLIDTVPSYCFHHSNNEVVMSIFHHQRGYYRMPTIVGSKGGKLHDFITKDIEEMIGTTTENKVRMLMHKADKKSSTTIESGGYASRVINIDQHFQLQPIEK